MTKAFGGRRSISLGLYRLSFEVENGSYVNPTLLRTKFGERSHSWAEHYSIKSDELKEICGWITGTDSDDVVTRRLEEFTDSRKPDK